MPRPWFSLPTGRSRLRWTLMVALLAAVTVITIALVVADRPRAPPAPRHDFFAAQHPTLDVIAHRGGSQLRPENTLLAFEHAVALGVDILEMDVRATADGALVVLHDATVDRTTNGQGPVAAISSVDLRSLDAGYRWSPDGGRSTPFRGQGIFIPTIEEVFGQFPTSRMVVELKPEEPALASRMCERIRRAGMAGRILVASVHDVVLDVLRDSCPEVATSMGFGEARLFYLASLFQLSDFLSPAATALQIPYSFRGWVLASAGLTADVRGRQLALHVWTVNDEATMRQLLALGVDGIVTARPDLLLRLRRGATAVSSPHGIGTIVTR